MSPACAQFDDCPGCPLRHLAPAAAARLKVDAARETFARLTGQPAPPGVFLAPTGRDAFRARLGATRLGETFGMRGLPGGADVDLRRCPAQTPESRAALETLVADLDALHLSADVTRAHVAATADGGVRVVLAAADRGALSRLRDAPWPERPGWDRFAKVPGPRDGDLESGAERLTGRDTMSFDSPTDRLQATLPAWVPQSPGTLPALLDWLETHLEPTGARLLELGSGVGTSSLPLARRAASLLRVDCVREAGADATENARRAGVDTARCRLGFADRAGRRLLAGGETYDAVLLHGMRAPFGERLMDALPALRARRVAYVAPVTASLARDVARLRGYSAVRLDFLDQMPGTAHIMALGLWHRTDADDSADAPLSG